MWSKENNPWEDSIEWTLDMGVCVLYVRDSVENRERILVTCLHVSDYRSDPHDCLSSQQRNFKLHLHNKSTFKYPIN